MKEFQLHYECIQQIERIGGTELRIQRLKDLDQAIDQVFDYLQAQGNAELLEELCPYFGVIWPAARGLCHHLQSIGRECLSQKRILEIGCGLALPSLLAAQLGAMVVATDCHPEVPRLLDVNMRENHLSTIQYVSLNWEKDDVSSLEGQFDFIMGSDILYEQRFPKSLSHSLKNLLAPEGEILISDPGRPYLQPFADEMKKLGFSSQAHIYTVEHSPEMKDVFVLSFKKTLAR
ncbi:methyltransferase domain-containing protein [bacterium]|jgi:predicted nicotinamide N-methyase|nr:methyltransferase domain-containing protein [bacterium]